MAAGAPTASAEQEAAGDRQERAPGNDSATDGDIEDDIKADGQQPVLDDETVDGGAVRTSVSSEIAPRPTAA